VAVHCDNQQVSLRFRLSQHVHMAAMEQVEAAVCKNHGSALCSGLGRDLAEFANAFQLVGHHLWVTR
ncbi:MAG TPA: hypothetical protein VMS25_01905, partial [Candidatus Limnocylindrales bacterium]|nr:hypothetical protein [Candidatus Limnocylindrales bacterium]